MLSARGHGSIVTVCSTSGFTASTGPMTAYDASKGAVRLLTQAAAREVAARGLRVNAVAPGTVETDLTLGLSSSDELAALGASRVPLGRLGLPEEIAAAVAFLSSDDASYVTGHVLVGRRRLARLTLPSPGFTMRTSQPPCERPPCPPPSAP